MRFSVPFRSEFTFYRSIKYSSHAEKTTIQTNSRKKKKLWNKWQLRQAKCWNSVYGYVHLIKWIDVSEMIEKLDLFYPRSVAVDAVASHACMESNKIHSSCLSWLREKERERKSEKKTDRTQRWNRQKHKNISRKPTTFYAIFDFNASTQCTRWIRFQCISTKRTHGILRTPKHTVKHFCSQFTERLHKVAFTMDL